MQIEMVFRGPTLHDIRTQLLSAANELPTDEATLDDQAFLEKALGTGNGAGTQTPDTVANAAPASAPASAPAAAKPPTKNPVGRPPGKKTATQPATQPAADPELGDTGTAEGAAEENPFGDLADETGALTPDAKLSPKQAHTLAFDLLKQAYGLPGGSTLVKDLQKTTGVARFSDSPVEKGHDLLKAARAIHAKLGTA